jgi:hypothetical protein
MPPDSDEEGLRQWAVRYMRRRRNVAGMGGAERCTRDVAWNPMLPQIGERYFIHCGIWFLMCFVLGKKSVIKLGLLT